MIRHIVMWTLAAEDDAERATAAAEIIAALTGLVGRVPAIQSLTVTANTENVEGNYDLVLEGHFADRAALDEYLVHPAHLEAVTVVRARVNGRAAIDYAS